MIVNSLGIYSIPVLSWWNALPTYNTRPIISTSSSPTPTTESTSSQSQTQLSVNCNPADDYVKFLRESFGSSVNLEIRERSPFMVYWKRKSSEPYISYPAKTKVEITLHLKASDVNKLYKMSVDNKFSPVGYLADPLNTATLTLIRRYGYRNGDSLIVVDICETYCPENYTYIHFVCGIIDQKYDALYTELLSSLVVTDDLKTSSSNKNGFQDMFFGIWKIHQNNILYTDIGTIGGGHAVWVQKVNNEWKLLFKGQQAPSCSVLENSGIESGVTCWDQGSDKKYFQRVTR